ncbi:hypothetical protein HDU99_004338 [Rhizoclosmatium hyalinum]|nr:hypothetical protein HDU99_004338 [Rhizoclosmatium hyalinum]
MDDGLIQVNGKTLHIDREGIVSVAMEGAPSTPSSFAEFMRTTKYSVVLDGEPKGILRGRDTPPPPMGSRSNSKKVSIKEPSNGVVVMEKTETKGNWMSALNPFKPRNESPIPRKADSPKPTFSERTNEFIGMLRSKSQTQRPGTASPAPSTYGLSTQKYQETPPVPPPRQRKTTLASHLSTSSGTPSELKTDVSETDKSDTVALAEAVKELVVDPPQPSENPPSSRDSSAKLSHQSMTPIFLLRSRSMTPAAVNFIRQDSVSKRSVVAPVSEPPTRTIPEMTRSGTVLSLSASEYHVQFSANTGDRDETKSSEKKMRTHVGTADHRAISRRIPELLLADLEDMFEQKGYVVASRSGEELGDYRLKVTKPGFLVRTDGDDDANDYARAGVPVSVSELSKVIQVPEELTTPLPQSGVVPLAPNISRTISKNEKLRQSSKFNRILAGLPTSLAKKLKYVKEYGVNYNSGFSGKQSRNAPSRPALEDDDDDSLNRNSTVASKLARTLTTDRTRDDPASGSKVLFVDEIVFYVELQKVPNLPGVCVVDFKRQRGNIWTFKKLYNQLVEELPVL